MSTLEKELDEEILERIILEKTGVIKSNDFSKKKKVKKKSSNFWFYFIGLTVIGLEVWYLYEYIVLKFPNLF